jgi:hypothetical protein
MSNAKHKNAEHHSAHHAAPQQEPSEETAPESAAAAAATSQHGIPCPPPGGATSVRPMSSTVTAVLTDYQYWNMVMHGHHPGSIA